MTSDPNVADPVKLAAIKDTLDRSGIQATTEIPRDRRGDCRATAHDMLVAQARACAAVPKMIHHLNQIADPCDLSTGEMSQIVNANVV